MTAEMSGVVQGVKMSCVRVWLLNATSWYFNHLSITRSQGAACVWQFHELSRPCDPSVAGQVEGTQVAARAQLHLPEKSRCECVCVSKKLPSVFCVDSSSLRSSVRNGPLPPLHLLTLQLWQLRTSTSRSRKLTLAPVPAGLLVFR